MFSFSFTGIFLYAGAQGALIVGRDPGSFGFPLGNSVGQAINRNNLVVAQGGLGSANAACTGTQGSLTITKLVQNTNGIAAGDLSGLEFGISFTVDGALQGTTLAGPLDSKSFCFDAGTSIGAITEISQPAGLAFTSQVSDDCRGGTIQTGQNLNCSITNIITSSSGGVGAVAQGGLGSGAATSNVGQKQLITPQSALGGQAGATTGEATASNLPTARQVNSPFQTCTANTVSGPTKLSAAGTFADEIIRAPSLAKYVVAGNVPLDKVKNALDSLRTNTIDIVISSDLLPNDGISLSVANAQFRGSIIVQDSAGLKQQVIHFNLDTIRTECQYITLAKGIGPANNAKVFPIGQMDRDRKNLNPPDTTKELIGGTTLGSDVKGPFPAVLNPPFATCQTRDVNFAGTAKDENADNLAFYNVKGDITGDRASLSGNKLLMEITVDLVQTDPDEAKILNNNNPYIKVNLISKEKSNSNSLIPFSATDVFTDCKKINLASNTIFKPKINELNP